MVGVAQLAEHRVVIPVVAGSTPVTHPTEIAGQRPFLASLTCGLAGRSRTSSWGRYGAGLHRHSTRAGHRRASAGPAGLVARRRRPPPSPAASGPRGVGAACAVRRGAAMSWVEKYRRQPVPGGVPRRRRPPALQVFVKQGRRQGLARRGRHRPGPRAVGRPARRRAAVPGLGRDLVRHPHRPPDHQRQRPRPVRQPPGAGVRGPAAEGPHADADPDVRRRAVRTAGRRDGAGTCTRCCRRCCATRSRRGCCCQPVPQDGAAPDARATTRCTCPRAALQTAAGRGRPALPTAWC